MPFNTRTMALTALRMAPDARRIITGTSATWGILNDDERLIDDGTGESVTVRQREVIVPADSLTGVTDGATMTVGTVSYTVRGRPRPQENGDLWAITVVRAS